MYKAGRVRHQVMSSGHGRATDFIHPKPTGSNYRTSRGVRHGIYFEKIAVRHTSKTLNFVIRHIWARGSH